MSILTNVTGLLTSWRSGLISAALVALLLAGVWYGGKHEGRAEQKLVYADEKAAATLEGAKAHDKINRDVQKLSDPDLDADLAQWMRD